MLLNNPLHFNLPKDWDSSAKAHRSAKHLPAIPASQPHSTNGKLEGRFQMLLLLLFHKAALQRHFYFICSPVCPHFLQMGEYPALSSGNTSIALFWHVPSAYNFETLLLSVLPNYQSSIISSPVLLTKDLGVLTLLYKLVQAVAFNILLVFIFCYKTPC